jgi:hypothetical protein
LTYVDIVFDADVYRERRNFAWLMGWLGNLPNSLHEYIVQWMVLHVKRISDFQAVVDRVNRFLTAVISELSPGSVSAFMNATKAILKQQKNLKKLKVKLFNVLVVYYRLAHRSDNTNHGAPRRSQQ